MKIDWSEVEWETVLAPLSGRWAPLYCGILHLSTRLFGEAIAIGDTINPVVPNGLKASLTALGFPMFYLPSSLSEWLKPILTDNGTIDLFTALDALFWTHLLVWLLSRLGSKTCLLMYNALLSCHFIFQAINRLAILFEKPQEVEAIPPPAKR